jgi:alkanesulfonate monooxygenase SsuD/methylene tetrahydromethanopterin reductase-like flavin-dependent oxidoreductase (luciferase family)
MEFGIFSQMFVPKSDDEHARFKRELEVAELVDGVGFKYDWAPEHHFLEEYSHQPAPECFLMAVAMRTRQIHIGHAIVNITPKVNHPARVAERIATMDHLTEGRVEFGTGRGSGSTEVHGFDIADMEETRAMWEESVRQIPRMWREESYSYEGKYFRMPPRNVLPKPYSKPHPPIWVACTNEPTFEIAGRFGLGALCFTLGTPEQVKQKIAIYKDAIRHAEPVGGFINNNVAVTTNMFCLEDGDEARHLWSKAGSAYYQTLFFKYLDSFKRPKELGQGPVIVPEPTPEALKERMKSGGIAVGSPDEVAGVVQMYADVGADQLIYSPLTTMLKQKDVLRSLETFGQHVLPRFSDGAVHSTTRQRLAAAA